LIFTLKFDIQPSMAPLASNKKISASFGLLLAGSAPLVAYSQVYMTEDQAVQSILPQGELGVRKTIPLTDEDIKAIESASGEDVRNKNVVVWVTPKKDLVFVDQVLGKHEFITYATSVSKTGKVTGIEILEYRETYGSQVKELAWKKQFYGKDSTAPLKVGKDIVNISGATLSSVHVTGGVRRLLQTYERIRSKI
jgi:Na+-translocating ferredoxin:NAD+ oxidoreductase RnfG subunit